MREALGASRPDLRTLNFEIGLLHVVAAGRQAQVPDTSSGAAWLEARLPQPKETHDA